MFLSVRRSYNLHCGIRWDAFLWHLSTTIVALEIDLFEDFVSETHLYSHTKKQKGCITARLILFWIINTLCTYWSLLCTLVLLSASVSLCAVQHRPALFCYSACQTKEYSQHTLLLHRWGVHLREVSLSDKQLSHINMSINNITVVESSIPLKECFQGNTRLLIQQCKH